MYLQQALTSVYSSTQNVIALLVPLQDEKLGLYVSLKCCRFRDYKQREKAG